MLPMAQSHALLFACLSLCELRRALSSLPNLGSHRTVAFTGESSHFPQRPAVQLDKIDKRGIQEQRQSEGKWLTCSHQLPAHRGWWQSQGACGTAVLRHRPSLVTGSQTQREQTPWMPSGAGGPLSPGWQCAYPSRRGLEPNPEATSPGYGLYLLASSTLRPQLGLSRFICFQCSAQTWLYPWDKAALSLMAASTARKPSLPKWRPEPRGTLSFAQTQIWHFFQLCSGH